MKKLILAIAVISCLVAQETKEILKPSEHRTIICKNGYLTSIDIKSVRGKAIVVESMYCDCRSVWNGECMHKPYKCNDKGWRK